MVQRTHTSVFRRLIPFVAFLSTFTIVMLLLLLSMDWKIARHRPAYNWTGVEDFVNVAQDNTQFITYIREKHLQPPLFYYHATSRVETILPQSRFVAKLFNSKRDGTFVEAGAYRRDRSSNTEWLEKDMGWHGLLIQPDPKDYSNLVKRNRSRSFTINACLSPTPYPKEVTFRLLNKNNSGSKTTFTKIKCFPLFSLLLAANLTSVDYLSLDAESAELQVLKTLPLDRVKIQVMSVKWVDVENTSTLVDFMGAQQYKLIHSANNYYTFLVNKIRI